MLAPNWMRERSSVSMTYHGVATALTAPDTQVRLFGKPEVHGERRLGVALALGGSIEEARTKASAAAAAVSVSMGD